jgi:antitoxin ParD1/3/4
MRTTQPLTITLPHNMLEMVKAKVSSGEDVTESEVIRDGLRTLQARDSALEKWLHQEVVKSYDECEADPTIGVPTEQLMTRIRAQDRKRTSAPQS